MININIKNNIMNYWILEELASSMLTKGAKLTLRKIQIPSKFQLMKTTEGHAFVGRGKRRLNL